MFIWHAKLREESDILTLTLLSESLIRACPTPAHMPVQFPDLPALFGGRRRGAVPAAPPSTCPASTIVWFRSDLRLHDNEALTAAAAAAAASAKGSLLPVYIFDLGQYGQCGKVWRDDVSCPCGESADSKKSSTLHFLPSTPSSSPSPHPLSPPLPSPGSQDRASFLLQSVANLRSRLRALGSDLILRWVLPSGARVPPDRAWLRRLNLMQFSAVSSPPFPLFILIPLTSHRTIFVTRPPLFLSVTGSVPPKPYCLSWLGRYVPARCTAMGRHRTLRQRSSGAFRSP